MLVNCSYYSQGKSNQLIAEWNFNNIEDRFALDIVSGIKDRIDGHFKVVDGVVGKAIKCDGFTTSISRDGDEAPRITGPFTIQAWVAPQAYPWNWCAVYNQEYHKQRGIFFGIDAEGRVGLHAAVARQWRECLSEDKIPFMKWSLITATFDPDSGLKVFIDGKLAGQMKIQGNLLYDREFEMQIARNHKLTVPSSLNRAGFVRVPASYSFDGIIDELKITGRVLSNDEIRDYYLQTKPEAEPQLIWRKLPHIPIENTEFGAFYTKLKYDADWDRLWRDDQYPDIVVTFPDKKYSMVFWKGTNYNMNLVTENGRWIADQSAETFGEMGCMEHMSDKQNRYSHVRIIENSDTRVVVHWRYALTDIAYQIANTDPVTNWGDWVDEYYTIYPDGIAIRHFIVHGEGEDEYSITEPALLGNPGEKPEDNIDLAAVTLANIRGEISTHSYETWPTDEEGLFKNAVDDAVISVINLKSKSKPFYIYEHGTRISPYGGGVREVDYRLSKFHWRNHWPVSQVPSDGRFVLANDRVTSSAITSPEPVKKLRNIDNSVEGRFIMGISDRPVKELIPFAKFWLSPPTIKIENSNYSLEGFNKNDRAYHISKNIENAGELKFIVDANPDSPLVNPVFIIDNWGNYNLNFFVNGTEINSKNLIRYSVQRTLKEQNLIVWLEINSIEGIEISMIPKLK